MSREILFRGMTEQGKWVYGTYHHYEEAGKTNILDMEYEPWVYDCHGVHEVKPETVGQYVGIKDRSGNKIFEGDKCSTLGYSDVFTVVFMMGSFMLESSCGKLCLHHNHFINAELTGNIHQ